MSRLKIDDALHVDNTDESNEDAYVELASYLIDANEDEQETSELIDLTTDLTDGEARLEQYHELCTTSLESASGGLDDSAARVLDIAINTICDGVGIEGYGSTALEAFDSPATRTDATEDVMVAIEGTMGKLAQGARNVIAKIWRKIKAFVAKFFANTGKLSAAITAAEVAIGKSKAGKGKKSVKISGPLVGRIYYKKGMNAINNTVNLATVGTKLLMAMDIKTSDSMSGKKSGYKVLKAKIKGKDLSVAVKDGVGLKFNGLPLLAGKKVAYDGSTGSVTYVDRTAKDGKLNMGTDAVGEARKLISSAESIVTTINALKAFSTTVDSNSAKLDKVLSELADSDSKNLSKSRVNASRITALHSALGVNLLGILMKGGWDCVKLVSSIAGPAAEKMSKSVDGKYIEDAAGAKAKADSSIIGKLKNKLSGKEDHDESNEEFWAEFD